MSVVCFAADFGFIIIQDKIFPDAAGCICEMMFLSTDCFLTEGQRKKCVMNTSIISERRAD